MQINSNLEIFKQSKILIVDDIPENVEVIANMLKILGSQLIFATDAKQALSIASVKIPDLILLDIQMPDMDGYWVCKQLKLLKETKDIPVIFVTAKTSHDDLVMAFDSGGVDFITKPFNVAELTIRVKTHLELKRTKDILQQQNKEIIQIQEKIAKDAQNIIIINEELQETQEQLKSINRTKDRLFNVISKDLKTPIQSLLFSSDTLSRHIAKISPEEISKQHKNIYYNVHYMNKQLDNLLFWAKLQLGGLSITKEMTDIPLLIEKNLRAFSIEIEKKHLTIEKNYKASFTINCDMSAVNSILNNVIDNSIFFSKRDGLIKISINENDFYTIISVEDNGNGINKESLANIFDSNYIFQQKNHSGRGIGLGLIISQELAKLNDCQIVAESEIGKWTKFSLLFKKS